MLHMQWSLPVQDHGPREMDVPNLIQWSCQLVYDPTCLNGQRLLFCDSSAAWNHHCPTTALCGCSVWSSSTRTYTINGWWNMISRHQSLVVSLAQMNCPKVWILFWHDVFFECTIIYSPSRNSLPLSSQVFIAIVGPPSSQTSMPLNGCHCRL